MAGLALIVTADDLGVDPRRDDGIFAAYEMKAITQASLLVNGPSSVEAARRARSVGLPVGLHLDLTEMPPCAPAKSVPSLLDGQGNKLGKHGFRDALSSGRVKVSEVIWEARAQLQRFAQLSGVAATHVDGHQHVHILPELTQALAALFAEQSVRTTRIPAGRATSAFYQQVQAQAVRARSVYESRGIHGPQSFIGLDLMGSSADVEALSDAVREQANASASSAEVMCHVGYAGTLGDAFNQSPEREHELEVICARPFAPLTEQGLVSLMSFDEWSWGPT